MEKSGEESSPADKAQQALALLQGLDIFASISPKILVRLLGAMEESSSEAKVDLFTPTTSATDLFLIASGQVQLLGPDRTILLGPGALFGEEAGIGLSRYLSTAKTQTPVTLWKIPKTLLSEQSKSLSEQLTLTLAKHLSSAETESCSVPKTKTALPQMSWREILGWIVVILAPMLCYPLGLRLGLRMEAVIFAAIMAMVIMMWVFTLVDEFIPPILALIAVLVMKLAPTEIALAGFASSGLMTLIGVFALSASLGASGLSYRVILWLLYRLPDRPLYHQSVLLGAGYALSPITPSGNSRLSLSLPLFREMLTNLRLPKGHPAATSLFAACFSGAMLFSPMLSTSKSSNITAITLLPDQVQEAFMGLYWLIAAGGAAIFLTLSHYLTDRWCFPHKKLQPLPKERMALQLALLGPLTRSEKISLLGFFFFLIGAGTVSWHHIAPAWIAGIVLIGLLLTGELSKFEFRRSLDWPMIFFLLGMDSITRVMSYLGLSNALAASVSPWFGFVDGNIYLFILVALACTLIVRLALPVTAGMLVSFFILLPVAQAQGIHPWICVFLTAMFSDIWFLPYQSSVYLQALSQGITQNIREPDFFRYNHVLNFARVLAAYASIPYWQWLGIL